MILLDTELRFGRVPFRAESQGNGYFVVLTFANITAAPEASES